MNPAVIDLTGATWVGQGNGRDCYVHPQDPGLVVKVPRQDRVSRRQNRLELLYLSSLLRRGVPFDHIPRLHGVAATTLGEGLVCERIADPDGQPCLWLMEAVRQGVVPWKRAQELLADLRAYLLRHWIAFADTGSGNLVWQRRPDGSGRLVILDGLGARHPNIWLQLHMRFPSAARRKTRKKWPRLLERLRGSGL